MSEKLLYKVEKSELLGRYFVAAKLIKPGEVILKEKPTIVGSQINGPLICFNCYSKFRSTSIVTCENCHKALVCSKNCTGNGHTKLECKALENCTKITPQFLLSNPQVILPLRCLLIKQFNNNLWQELIELEPHIDTRRDSWIWKNHCDNVEKPLEKLSILSREDISTELIQKLCGILDVNSFEIRPPNLESQPFNTSDCLRGIYPKAAMLAHDCVSNTMLAIEDGNFEMTIRASCEIAEGGVIYFNYANVLQGNLERTNHLSEGKYFKCTCKRCSDPTEFGTNLSGILCTSCKKGIVNPLCAKIITWTCNSCAKIYKNAMIKSAIGLCQEILNEKDCSNIKNCEAVLEKLLRTLSPQHYVVLELKQNMISVYGAEKPTQKLLCRRIELCNDLLNVLEVIEPGLSRLQGITQFELHVSKLELAELKYQTRGINTGDYLQELLITEEHLRKAVKILLYEPKNSPEGRLAMRAMTALKVLRVTIGELRKILIDTTFPKGK